MVQHWVNLIFEKILLSVHSCIVGKNELIQKLFLDVVIQKVEDHPGNAKKKDFKTQKSFYLFSYPNNMFNIRCSFSMLFIINK
jgi:hypothetical protein